MEIIKAILGILSFSFVLGGSYIWTMALSGIHEDSYMDCVGALIFVPFLNLYYIGKILGNDLIGYLLIAISIAKLFAPYEKFMLISGISNAVIFVFLMLATVKACIELNTKEIKTC